MSQKIITEKGYIKKPVNIEQTLRKYTLNSIGTPDDLIRVQVKRLHDNSNYRVNVYRRIDGNCRLSDSFYVSKTLDGFVSNPPMESKY